jgi:hypothetical protein
MKIQHPRWAWGGESHKELESLLYSIPRQELGMEALGESEFGLLEWRKWACSTEKWVAKRRDVGGGVYTGISQKSSRWAKIQNPDKVQEEPDNVCLGWKMSGKGFLLRYFEF